ncbi:MAG: AarF/ABC1/UbiB kinase family protein, partial [Bacteroidetes bacterium]|nr:AarF/ABC1/UbiB kinase family protein [Bacteroidota bacterium]
TMGVIDFGCVKVIPDFFYDNYFALINPDTVEDNQKTEEIFYNLEFLVAADTPADKKLFSDLFKTMIGLLGKPFAVDEFDFGDASYFDSVYAFADELARIEELKNSKVARGSQHGLYINRTYFGLYSMLHELGAKVKTNKPDWLISKKKRQLA